MATLPTDLSSGVVTLPPGVTFVTSPKNFIRGYLQSYNLMVEHDFGHAWIAQAGYVGMHTVHQHTRYDVNYGLPGQGAASQPFYNEPMARGLPERKRLFIPTRA